MQKLSVLNLLKSYFKPEILVILFFGLSCGLPLALIISTLKALLFDKGFDIKIIGFLSLVSLPYSIKFFWAPFVDSLPIPYLTKRLGKYRTWILITQLLLIASICVLGIYGAKGDLFYISVFAVLTAFFSATQDIAVDAYRIETIKKENQAIAAAMYIYGYRVGMLISGAGALFLSDHISWGKVYYIMSALMLIGIVSTLLAREKPAHFLSDNRNFLVWIKNAVIEPIADFLRRDSCYIIFAFVVFFKLSDAFAGALTLPFLLDIDFSKTEIAAIVKTFGLFATLAGVFLGGILVKFAGMTRSLWIAIVAGMLSNLVFYYLALIGHNTNALYMAVFIENFSGGIGDAVFVAYLSSLCNVSFTATQYAILVSFATVGRSILSSTTGVFAEYLGWANFFLFSTAAAIPGILLLFLLTKTGKLAIKV